MRTSKHVRTISWSAILLFGISACSLAEPNQSPESNQGKTELAADLHMFGGNEKTTVLNLKVAGNLAADWKYSLAGSFARRSTFNTSGAAVRTGGSDVEGQIGYTVPSLPRLTFYGGLSLPNTPMQTKPFITAAAIYDVRFESGSLYFGAKGAFRKDSDLAGIFVGGRYAINDRWELTGDFAGIVVGDNTFGRDGGRRRTGTYGAGFGYRFCSDGYVTAGITNALGWTTGFSLTPGLNNSAALSIGVRISR